MDFLTDLAQYAFLQKGLLTAVLVGVLGGVVGSFVILRGLALIGDAISHAVLPGVAISYMLGINFLFGAFGFGLLTAFGIGYIGHRTRIRTDASIGIMFSTFLALGVILAAKAQTAVDLTQILFGNVLAVSDFDMYLTIVVSAVILTLAAVFYKQLKVATFDPTFAQVYGVPVQAIHYALLVALTLVSVVALQTVGVLLVVAVLVIPASAALLLTNRLSVMLFLAAAFGTLSAMGGLFLSIRYNLPSGAVVVLVAFVIFAAAFITANVKEASKSWRHHDMPLQAKS